MKRLRDWLVLLLLLALPTLGALLSCGSSSLRVKVIFPDDAARDQSATLVLLAVEANGEPSCVSALGQPASELGSRVLSSLELDLANPGAAPSLPNVPMHRIFLTALVLDKDAKLFLQACAVVDAHPGDDLEVVLRLNCAKGRTPCLDLDGDGVPADRDCDDTDPCRSPDLGEAGNLCTKQAADFPALPAACLKKLQEQGKTLAPPYCDDGIDEDCDGQDIRCTVDEDCDTYSPPLDCDDHDPDVHPGATESCDGKDHNCNGIKDEGCNPCDVDGDGHAATSNTSPSCTLNKDDPDDNDAGIYPGSTAKTNGVEGGNVLGALRGWCRQSPPEKDGKAPRDVDHDGDKLTAAQDGCPTTSCDADGDGFPGKQCAPPASLEDCDDNDSHTFPGAPDKCGDGKAQNCIADSSCACDKDGDGYCAPADCDDGDPLVHPWAAEPCNGKDDDCDELIDEGNPDATGNPMSVTAKSCNDSNIGWCGDCKYGQWQDCKNNHLLTGTCICSPITPTGKRDGSGNRVSCPGENLGAKASARCFNARQPQVETCNGIDDDCNGTVDDQSSVCTGGLTCCANGAKPGCKNLDTDFDHCGGCETSCDSGLASQCVAKQCRCGSVAACANGYYCGSGSCRCDGCTRSGTCYAGNTTADCGQGGGTCTSCGSSYYCGSSGTCDCDGCVSGSTCLSGTSNTACGKNGVGCVSCSSTGKTCSSQTCVCNGCLIGTTCYNNDPARCGSGCLTCSAGTCQVATCNGSCGTIVANNGTGCTGGVCISGACCTGCVIGGTSCNNAGATTFTACGTSGAACIDCTGVAGATQCLTGVCSP
jgi:hypothetical protein